MSSGDSSVAVAAAGSDSEPIVPIVPIESAPDSDATMLQALDAAAAGNTEEQDEDEYTFGGPHGELTSVDQFEKTLQSDVNENQALLLLCDVQSCDPVFSLFNDDDLERLARYLSVLSFDAGERIISKGEPASFCGIVLSGRFHAVLSQSTTIPLVKGALVGEMSYYEGGKRTADIDCAEPSVVAVISFSDLKKLQPFESALVQKFLHMLAVISIRKLRNMMKPQESANNTTSEEKKPEGSDDEKTDSGEKKPDSGDDKPSDGPSAASDHKSDSAQESLFKHRLKKKEAALEQNAAELEEARKEADAARRKQSLAQKKRLEQKYKADSLEHKLAKVEKELVDARLEQEKATQSQEKTHKQNLLLMGQIVNMTTARVQVDKDLVDLQSRLDTATSEREELARGTGIMIANLEEKVDALTKAAALTRQHLDAEQGKSKLLTSRLDDLSIRRDGLESDHRSIARELEVSRGSILILQEKVSHLDTVRRDYLARLNEEELSHIAWKSKAELYLGDYTRLTSRVKEMELAAADATRDRRLTLRKLAQLRALLKQIIVRSFIRNVRTRRLIFAILKRVNSVVTSRIDVLEDSDTVSGSFSSGDPDDMSPAGENQVVSAAQARKDRAKLLLFLKSDRTPVSKLIWLLDEELNNFESPFTALQTENTQLRHTLDSFFKRNIGLVQQFMAAKQTYESLHREYARLRDAFDRLKRREKAAATVAAAMAGGQAGMLVRAAAEEDDEDAHGSGGVSTSVNNFTPSLPTPTPFSPATLHPLTSSQLTSYAAAFSSIPPVNSKLIEPNCGGISVGGPRSRAATPSGPMPSPPKKTNRFAASSASGAPAPAQEHTPFSPRPPSSISQAGSRPASSPRAPSRLSAAPAPQSPFTGSPWQPHGSYDISQRSGGNDVASRSEALRHQIQASIQQKAIGTAVTRDSWTAGSPRMSPPPSALASTPMSYPHVPSSLRSPASAIYTRHIDTHAFDQPQTQTRWHYEEKQTRTGQ